MKRKTLRDRAEKAAKRFGCPETWRENSNCWDFGIEGMFYIDGYLAGYRAGRAKRGAQS